MFRCSASHARCGSMSDDGSAFPPSSGYAARYSSQWFGEYRPEFPPLPQILHHRFAVPARMPDEMKEPRLWKHRVNLPDLSIR